MDSGGGGSPPSSCPDARKRRVSYFYEPTISQYYYGNGHLMKPYRIAMAHTLITRYSLDWRMDVIRPSPATPDEILRFHSPEYISTGGSIGAAVKLNRQDADIAINWAGGLNHAKRSEASGYCYVNDAVLGIIVLLKVHRRVLYVDIDVHHGDGVEEAFYELGHIKNIGRAEGKCYALNVLLNDGLDDDNLHSLFRPIIHKIMEVYQPDAVVLQCGAGSLAGDRIWCFNMSIKGHADCLPFLRSFNVPFMVLGGGGYTIRNVNLCWCYETAVPTGVELDNKLPYNCYYEYFGPDYTLLVEPNHIENLNTERDLENVRNTLLDQLCKLEHAPSVSFQLTPPIIKVPEEREEDMEVRPRPRVCDGVMEYGITEYRSDDDDVEEEPREGSMNSDGSSDRGTGAFEYFHRKLFYGVNLTSSPPTGVVVVSSLSFYLNHTFNIIED
ncbi:hypothetical protein BUALT_Bualt07G0022200 [Buddleja alternifolia]|uniref:histone deacetylase n=1 Tax=Buddleja alternifolia TaxID=168488 RepID=A0AAV6XE79_9LAMI|nr:hypothetical protein BUALT_Bualt07G0022200 [Buddleja alternifolia]